MGRIFSFYNIYDIKILINIGWYMVVLLVLYGFNIKVSWFEIFIIF